jgi:two-component system OmpR family sensor kinase
MKLWRATLSRRIFAWFAATISLTILTAGALAWLTTTRGESSLPRHLEKMRALTARQFSQSWADPRARDALASDIAEELDVQITLRAPAGALLSRHGRARCDRPHFPVLIRDRDHAPLGTMEICDPHGPHRVGGLFAALATLTGALWLASWLVARQIARPLRQLAAVAEALGHGDLLARAPQIERRHDEIGALATTLHDMAARIEQQLKDQKTLLGAVSHELRTPLGHMQLLIELARDEGAAPARLDELSRELHEMNDLVDQLLATTRLHFRLEQPRLIDLAAIALEALDREGLPPELLEVDGDPHADGDPTLLLRALANLLRNGQRHGLGVARLWICADTHRVQLTVEDRGPGLPDTERQRLFDPFVQGVSRDRAGGLGLGLYLVRGVARAHGGEAIAHNLTPQGASIGLWLPRRAAPKEQ